jgi:hypothetical protein
MAWLSEWPLHTYSLKIEWPESLQINVVLGAIPVANPVYRGYMFLSLVENAVNKVVEF